MRTFSQIYSNKSPLLAYVFIVRMMESNMMRMARQRFEIDTKYKLIFGLVNIKGGVHEEHIEIDKEDTKNMYPR
jgi:hypothetical protein